MESSKLGSGDNQTFFQLSVIPENGEETKYLTNNMNDDRENVDTKEPNDLSPEIIDEHEKKLKDRITQCRNVIEALKQELNEEKCKMENICKSTQNYSERVLKYTDDFQHTSPTDLLLEDLTFSSSVYSTCVDRKLSCDESLVEYEKQLQKYQTTLNIAQMEKKNAIRKQMLSKAYRLKLLEVENQCNIELLRVKQSLQCLEPLQMIASKWKSNTDDFYDNNAFEWLPRYPDFNSNCGSDFGSIKGEIGVKTITEIPDKCVKDDSA